jgi:hypothetical protein
MNIMPKCYAELILSIDPNADVERVGDIADAHFRYFSEMTQNDWERCVAAAARKSS